MKNKKIVFYTIYKEEESTNDLKYIANFDTLDQITRYLKAPKKTIKNRIADKKKILNKYIIYKDYISINDL